MGIVSREDAVLASKAGAGALLPSFDTHVDKPGGTERVRSSPVPSCLWPARTNDTLAARAAMSGIAGDAARRASWRSCRARPLPARGKHFNQPHRGLPAVRATGQLPPAHAAQECLHRFDHGSIGLRHLQRLTAAL